jgi:hypothetical protein
MLELINLTPHAICHNDGRVWAPSGVIARVSATYTPFDENGVSRQVFGDVRDLPEVKEGTMYIVSALILGACDRSDLVAPATGHPDCVRNDKGHIVSVPGFVSK